MLRRRARIVLAAVLLLYVGSYLVLSRQGFAQSDRWGVRDSFWFFEPRDSGLWRLSNYGCVCFYLPLIAADNCLGTGRWPAGEPLLGLSK